MYIIGEVVSVFVHRIVNLDNLVNTDEDVCDGHLVHGEGSGLVGADVVGTAHDFARGKLLHEVLINEHLSHGIGKSDHDGKRKTLRYSDDDDSDGDDQVLEPFNEVGPKVMDVLVKNCVVSKEVHLAVGELLNKESEKKHMEGQQGSVHTKTSEILTDFVELDLQGSLLIRVLLELCLNLAIATVLTNNNSDKPAFTCGNLSTGEKDRGGNVVCTSLLSAELSQLFFSAILAEFQSFLFKLI